ncbi:MAG: hypothetical protein MAG453_01110 [Calditrichaeota bacterium]|nr:hypothetical protein [Calditrichota bacterium]
MSEQSSGRPSLLRYIGGPWVLIGMAVVSLAGMVIALLRRKRRPKLPPLEGDRSFTLAMLTGTWYELAHLTAREAEARYAVSFRFRPARADEIQLRRSARTESLHSGPVSQRESRLFVPDATRPWELVLRQPQEPDEDVTVVHADAALGVLVLAWRGLENVIVLHDDPSMDEARYEDLLAELAGRGLPVERFRRTPQP